MLFNDSIANNIRYNKEELTLDDVRAAAAEANFNPEAEKFEARSVSRRDEEEEAPKG